MPVGRRVWVGTAAALGGVALTTLLIAVTPGATHVANISLLYLAVVIACGLWFGSGPAILASLLAFLVFDFCFVTPRQTFTVDDPAEWLALLMFLLTAVVTGQLTAQLQAKAAEAERREQETLALGQERERLMQAQLKANALAEADRLKTALLAMVSHDFRSPLASIKASAASLSVADASLDAATRHDLLTGITHETDRLDRMVGNILALSRLDADAWRPQTEPTLIAEVIEAGLAAFSPAENHRIRVELAEPLLEARLDAVQIARVLHNLVENALKYAPADPDVTVHAWREGGDLLMAVRDRGPGIGPGDAGQVFERFYRAPNLHESAVPGLGIGLAICKGLVEAHGGHLRAANRDGGGTGMTIRLPAAVCGPATTGATP